MNIRLLFLLPILTIFLINCNTYSNKGGYDMSNQDFQTTQQDRQTPDRQNYNSQKYEASSYNRHKYERQSQLIPESTAANLMGTYFDDVEIPALMSPVRDESLILDTANFIGGSLAYKGNLGIEVLIRFFKEHMPQKGWSFEGISYTKNNAIIAFLKPNKNCIIHLSRRGTWGNAQTKLQVWISNTRMKTSFKSNFVKEKEQIKSEEFLLE